MKAPYPKSRKLIFQFLKLAKISKFLYNFFKNFPEQFEPDMNIDTIKKASKTTKKTRESDA